MMLPRASGKFISSVPGTAFNVSPSVTLAGAVLLLSIVEWDP